MLTLDLAKESLVHIAAVLGVGAMFFRSQLVLRALILSATAINIVFFLVVPIETLWGPVIWGMVSFAVNGTMIGLLVIDRTMFGLDADEVRLFRAFRVFSPGEYRSLMRGAVWHEAQTTKLLTSRGMPLAELFYVIEGDVRVAKSRGAFPIPAGTFIGEVAFLCGSPASATVSVGPGTRYVSWDRAELDRLLEKKPAIRIALAALLNIDMAGKVAAETTKGTEPVPAAPLAIA